MHDELVVRLRNKAGGLEYDGWVDTAAILEEAADAIEELSRAQEQWIEQERKMLLKSIPRWIPVTERLPEESEGLDFHEDMMIRFTSVWCCDVNTGTINVRNRFQHKKTGIQFLDQNIQDTDWHWSKSWWEPTHWMPIVPLPEPPEGDA